MKHIWINILGISFLLTISLKAIADERSFSGMYMGFETGYGSVELNDVKDTGKVSVGGILGYRYHLESGLILGVEGGYASISYDSWGGYDNSTVDLKNSWHTSGLVGFAFGARSENLMYGKIGYNRYRLDLISSGTDGNPENQVRKESDGGMRYGIGYERKVTDTFNVRIGGEYAKHTFYKQLEGKVALIVTF